MRVDADSEFTAVLQTPGNITGLGARIEQPVTRAILAARVAAEKNPDTGVWSVTLTAPAAAGDYQLVWITADDLYEVWVPLLVDQAGSGGGTPGTDWTPSVQDVADVSPEYTRLAIDDDEEQAGEPQHVFDEDTDPTAAQVDGYIQTAVDEVCGRVGVSFDTLSSYAELAKSTATWHAASSIEAMKEPGGPEEVQGARSWKWSSYTACLAELIRHVGRHNTRLT